MNNDANRLSHADMKLIDQARSIDKIEKRRWLTWFSLIVVVIGALLIVAGNPADNKTWGFALLLVSANMMGIAYARFRFRALVLIYKLQLANENKLEGGE